MQTLARLGPQDLVQVMTAFRDGLATHREAINRLNVYPVPDGDTGTNMSLTVEAVVADLAEVDHDDLQAVARAVAHGSLMGARGNSGVILSQILRGMAAAIGPSGGVDAGVLRSALAEATEGAYRAVQQPVEGTILTVIRAASEAIAGAGDDDDLGAVAGRAHAAAAEALAGTTEMLPALQAAGVVDSGGTGLLLWFDALLHVVEGRAMPEVIEGVPGGPPGEPAGGTIPAAPGGGTERVSPDGPRYEVMYLLEAADDSIEGFRRAWATVGESIVVVGGDGMYNCHIHTDDIGASIEAAIDIGRPCKIRVTDLLDEVEEERWVRQAGPPGEQPADDGHLRTTAVVAVCTGEGVKRIFESLGVTGTVAGGQSMNPSTSEVLKAIEGAPGTEVVVLPNNKNIIAVAEAAAEEASKPVEVVPTRGIPEGFAALLDYDPEDGAASNASAMAEAAAAVTAGEVTRAVRAATSPAGDIAEGDWLGISRSGIEVVAPDVAGAATGLLQRLLESGRHEVATIITGDGADPATTRRITDWLDEHHPGVAGEVHQGGQPLYPYLFGVE
jgi:DAK2 domain fusion protein YloV